MTSLELAILFHETYERLAPRFGYETRPETRAFDPNSANGKLMGSVCDEVLSMLPNEAENRAMRGMIRACAAHCADERFQKAAQKFTDQWA